jgi:hypothetical protein
MKKINLYILIATLFAGMAVQVVFAHPAFAIAYAPQGDVVSANLLSGTSASSITNFYYNITSLPGNSSVTVQFSKDNTNWYSAAGTLNASTTLSTTGGANLSLASLAWTGTAFYYKMFLNATSDLTGTPKLSSVRLDYTPTAGYASALTYKSSTGYVGIGTATPTQLLSVGTSSQFTVNTVGAVVASTGTLTGNLTTAGSIGVGTGSTNSFGSRLVVQGSTADSTTSAVTLEGSTGSVILFARDDGNVGIGNSAPGGLLDVSGVLAGTPSATVGAYLSSSASAFTDTATAASGTATGMVFNSIAAPTLAAKYTSVTTTNAYTLSVLGAPIAGTNETLVNSTALNVASAAVTAGVTNSYGLQVNAQSGATNNYAAALLGGYVGIGTTAPKAALDVSGSIIQTSAVFATETLATATQTGACSGVGTAVSSTTAVFKDNSKVPLTSQIFYNTTSAKLAHATISAVATCTDGGANKWYVLTLANSVSSQSTGDTITLYTPAGDTGNGTSGFTNNLYAISGHFVSTVASGGFDVAEQYQTADATIGAGSVVSVDPANADQIVKSGSGYDVSVVGVVSTTPGMTLGANLGAAWQKVALTGRVPVLVTDENGVPQPGDFLTASAALPGYAMKATHSGKVVGEVLAPWSTVAQQAQVVNGAAIHTEEVDVDLHVGWENVDNTFVVGAADPAASLASVQQAQGSAGSSLAASPQSNTFIIRQNAVAGQPLADILQLQSGSVTRLMVASSGAVTINESVPDTGANLFAISNNGTGEFSISATGNVQVGGTLVVKQDIAALGEVLGSTAILAQNGSTGALHQGEVVMLSGVAAVPVVGSNPVITVVPAVATAADSVVAIGIVDRNLAEFDIPGAPAASGSDITVVAPGEYADVVTSGTYASLDVDASSAAIAVGDRLTVSANPGYARKLVLPADAGMPVVGVALDALGSGTGNVRVLLTLGASAFGSAGAGSQAPAGTSTGLDPAVYGQGFDWGTAPTPTTAPSPTPVAPAAVAPASPTPTPSPSVVPSGTPAPTAPPVAPSATPAAPAGADGNGSADSAGNAASVTVVPSTPTQDSVPVVPAAQ